MIYTTTETLEEKRGRERPREIRLDTLVSYHGGTSVSEMVVSTSDRRLWIDMISKATWHGQ